MVLGGVPDVCPLVTHWAKSGLGVWCVEIGHFIVSSVVSNQQEPIQEH